MRLKKVLLVSSYSDDCAGGIVTWTGNFLDSEWAKNNRIVFLNLYSSRRSKKRKMSSAVRDYKKTLKFKKLLRQEKPDVVHINFGGSVLGLIRDSMMANYALKHGFKVFMQCHCDANDVYQNKASIHVLKKVASNGAKFFVLNSQSKKYLTEIAGAKEANVIYVPNFAPAQDRHCQISQQVRRVIFVGHVRKAKGVGLIFSLARDYPNISFTFVGPDFNDVQKPYLKNIAFMGELTKGQALEQMLNSDLLLLPSMSEGLPMVILEAMSFGLPVIASEVGDVSTVLSGTDAGLCPCGSYDELSKIFKRYVDDFELRDSASKTELAKFASNYETEVVMAQMGEDYAK